MNQRELGTNGLAVSAVGLSCMGMSHAYGTAPDRREMTGLLAEAYGTPEEPHHNETNVLTLHLTFCQCRKYSGEQA